MSERTLCGALIYILQLTLEKNSLTNYFVDIEYNRVKNGCKKVITYDKLRKSIVCDLIVHSRGNLIENDNLIALEMKKSYRSYKDKEDDKNRLKLLTKQDDYYKNSELTRYTSSFKYILGIYYEINIKTMHILIEFYKNGVMDEVINETLFEY